MQLARMIVLMIMAWVVQANAAVISTFDTDTEGWQKLAGSDGGSSVQWVSTGGNPGGYVVYNEAGAGFIDFLAAPASFLGDQSGAYGYTLSFDIRTNTLSSPTNRNDQVKLIGAGITLRFQLPNPSPVNEWHFREIDLTASAGWINDATGLAPTQADMLAVLGDLTGLHLLTDYRSGSEQVAYDNIAMIPEPTALALLVLGGVVLFTRRRARWVDHGSHR